MPYHKNRNANLTLIAIFTVALFVMMSVAGCREATNSPTPKPSTETTIPPTVTPVPASATSQTTPTVLPATETPSPLTGSGGGRIVFASKRVEDQYEIFVMNADGTDKRRLTHTPYEDTDPIWSRDGTLIAFVSDRSGRFEIYLMNADGSNERKMTNNGGWGPTWSPDDSLIAFERIDEENPSNIYVMNSDGTGERRLTQKDSDLEIYNSDWSPDGNQIVCAVEPIPETAEFLIADSTINIIDIRDLLQGTGDTILVPLPRASDRVNDWPKWSPDGSQILFSSMAGRHRDLFIIDADGTNLRNVTNSQSYDEFALDWSPDGTRIAFQSSAEGGWDIYVMNLDGTDLQRLTNHEANDVSPSWTQ
jgi:Tol biopolymer transport system component